MSQRFVYLDHNATTPVRPEVVEAMLPYLTEQYGNPGSPYALGQRARKAVERAREQVAALVGAADPSEIVFTSCGSESDSLAVLGGAWQRFEDSRGRANKIISTKIEHDAVREALACARRRGFVPVELGCGPDGVVSAADVEAALDEDAAVVSVMHANNEVGTLQPVVEIARACRARGVLFHVDAVQSAGKVRLEADKWGVDLLAVSGHKLNAPKGVGALYVRKGVRLAPLVTGKQEKNRRGGTENVASIVGFGRACELAAAEGLKHASELSVLRDRIESGILSAVPGARVNGAKGPRLPNCTHFSFEGLDGHQLVVALDLEGVCVSSGPACSTGASTPSHVLSAMGVDPRYAMGSLRLSLGYGSSTADVERLLEVLPKAVEKLRKIPASLI